MTEEVFKPAAILLKHARTDSSEATVGGTGAWMERIAAALARGGHECADLRVVLLFLPQMPYAGTRFDTASKDTITRNPIYVTMTRAGLQHG